MQKEFQHPLYSGFTQGWNIRSQKGYICCKTAHMRVNLSSKITTEFWVSQSLMNTRKAYGDAELLTTKVQVSNEINEPFLYLT